MINIEYAIEQTKHFPVYKNKDQRYYYRCYFDVKIYNNINYMKKYSAYDKTPELAIRKSVALIKKWHKNIVGMTVYGFVLTKVDGKVDQEHYSENHPKLIFRNNNTFEHA